MIFMDRKKEMQRRLDWAAAVLKELSFSMDQNDSARLTKMAKELRAMMNRIPND